MSMAEDLSLEEIERFWEAIGPVRLSERSKQYCLKWVRDYHSFCELRRLDLASPQSLIAFSDAMIRSGRLPFQIDQAHWAVRFFLREAYQPTAASSAAAGTGDGRRTAESGRSDQGQVAIPPEWRTVLARLSEEIRLRHLSPRTLKAYSQWARAFALSVVPLPPGAVTAAHAREFLSGLVRSGVAGATQNQAFSALLFLYRVVLGADPGVIAGVVRAARPRRLPVVLTRAEARAVLAAMPDPYRLMGELMYGSGLRLLEVLRLRGLATAAVVISQDADPAAPDLAETVELVMAHAHGVPVFAAPRGADQAWAAPVLNALLGG